MPPVINYEMIGELGRLPAEILGLIFAQLSPIQQFIISRDLGLHAIFNQSRGNINRVVEWCMPQIPAMIILSDIYKSDRLHQLLLTQPIIFYNDILDIIRTYNGIIDVYLRKLRIRIPAVTDLNHIKLQIIYIMLERIEIHHNLSNYLLDKYDLKFLIYSIFKGTAYLFDIYADRFMIVGIRIDYSPFNETNNTNRIGSLICLIYIKIIKLIIKQVESSTDIDYHIDYISRYFSYRASTCLFMSNYMYFVINRDCAFSTNTIFNQAMLDVFSMSVECITKKHKHDDIPLMYIYAIFNNPLYIRYRDKWSRAILGNEVLYSRLKNTKFIWQHIHIDDIHYVKHYVNRAVSLFVK